MHFRTTLFALGIGCLLTMSPGEGRREFPRPASGLPIVKGEFLQYAVEWWIFRLGTIGVVTDVVEDSTYGTTYLMSISLESNPTIFFLDIHSRYESRMSVEPVRCLEFKGTEVHDGDTIVTRYWIVDSLRQVRLEQRNASADTLIKSIVVDSVDVFYEGASLFALARSLLQSGLQIRVPVLVDLDFFPADITFTSSVVPTEIDAVPYAVETKELFGKAHFVGKSLAGFSGEFRGWFTNDEAAIPLLAEMNISFGTADVILERWSRQNWVPPPYRKRR